MVPASYFRSISTKKIVTAVGIFLAYLLAAKAATLLYNGGRSAPAIIFPAAGVAIAVLFLEGYAFWAVIALASLVNSFISGTAPIMALGITTGSVLQALAGTYLLKRFKFDPRIWRFRDMALMVGVAVLVTTISPTVNALISTISGIPGTIASPLQRWTSLWLGGVLSVMLLTPFLISWLAHPKVVATRKYFFEAGLAFLFLIAISFVIYWTPNGAIRGVPLVYILLIPLFWISLRFGNRETIAALLVTTILSFAGAIFGYTGQPESTLGIRLFQLQLFSIIIGGIFFIVSSISEERRMAEAVSRGYITQLEAALEKLRSADRAKTEFIAVLAHELRNPLAPALSSLEFLELQAFSTPEKEAAALQAKRNIKNMSRLLDDLLDVSRISQGKVKLQKRSMSVANVLNRAIQNTQEAISKRKHTLSVELSPELPEIVADPLRLEQIIVNLLANATKYMEPGGHIWVTGAVKDEKVIIKVKDAGMGIAPEFLPSIFEMFNQAGRQSSRTPDGLGIGLSLVKKLTELHGGTVTAESAGLGQGSEFTVKLPITKPTENVSASSAVLPASGSGGNEMSKKRVLIIDDNEAAANALVKLFAAIGQEAHAVYNGPAGIEEASKFLPDLILLDIGLPGMDGYEVVKELRGQEAFAKTIIAAVSGYGQEEDRQRSEEAGFDYHLVKPVDLDTWRSLLAKI